MSFLQKLSARPFAGLFATASKASSSIARFTPAQRYYSDKGKAPASQLFDDLIDDEVEFTKPIEEVLPDSPTKSSNLSTSQKGIQRDPIPEPYLAHRATMKRKFPEGWNPPKKLSRQLMDDMRALKRLDPEKFTIDALASQFRVSPEAVRRILRSRWAPDAKRGEELQERDEAKRAQTLEYYKQLRERRKAAREKAQKRSESEGSPSGWKQARYGQKEDRQRPRRFDSRPEQDGFTLMAGADLSSPDIQDAYRDVRDDKTPTNWMLINYEGPRSDVLTLTATGEGGLNELKGKLQDEDCAFAYARVEYSNDKESKRVKFVLITWIGEKAGVMRKAKVSVHSGDVKKQLSVFSIEVPARTHEDVDEDHIVTRLRKAGGASYDGV